MSQRWVFRGKESLVIEIFITCLGMPGTIRRATVDWVVRRVFKVSMRAEIELLDQIYEVL